ncbi:hypothetical protein YC2023_076440 [Brassica napus]
MSATQEEDTKHRLGGAHTNLKVKGQCDKAFVLPVPASDEGLAFFVLDPKPIDIYETGAEYPPYDGNEVFSRIKSSTQLKKLMDAYDFREHKQCRQIKISQRKSNSGLIGIYTKP